MKRIILFKVCGDPVAQGRPRFASKGRGGKPLPFVRTYDPKKSRDWKEDVRLQAITCQADTLLQGALKMNLTFILQRPKGHYGKKGLRPSAPFYHITKPDLDNMVKGIKDALSGVCYERDQQICELHADKEYTADGEAPGVTIRIEELELA